MSQPEPTPSGSDRKNSEETQQRAAQFEETLSFQQRTLDEFHEVVLRQQSELDKLRRDVERLQGEVQRLGEVSESDLPPDEKPPHY